MHGTARLLLYIQAANEVASSEFRAVPSGDVDVGGQDMEKSLSLAALAMSAIYSLPCGADPGEILPRTLWLLLLLR